jgi:hypothetical protein
MRLYANHLRLPDADRRWLNGTHRKILVSLLGRSRTMRQIASAVYRSPPNSRGGTRRLVTAAALLEMHGFVRLSDAGAYRLTPKGQEMAKEIRVARDD